MLITRRDNTADVPVVVVCASCDRAPPPPKLANRRHRPYLVTPSFCFLLFPVCIQNVSPRFDAVPVSDFYGQVQERSDGRWLVGIGCVFGPVGVYDEELGGYGRQIGTPAIRKDR